MYSVILVDDERSLRESIERLVDWEGHGFQLIGTAENGLDAIELIEKEVVPDLVITDIKMPVMDGIDFAKALREDYPSIKIAFLSGYDEFQYAVEGIRLNVVSYLLKPISKNEVEEFLSNLKETMDEEIYSVNDLSRVSEEYNKNIELIKASFLNSLLTEYNFEGSEKGIMEFLKTHNMEFLKQEKIICTVRFSEPQILKENTHENIEFQRFSLFQIIQDLIKKYSENVVFLFSSYVVCILTGVPEELNDMKDIFAKDVIDTTKKLLNKDVVIGGSDPYQDIFGTRKAYRDTLTALDYTNSDVGENSVFISDVEKTASRPEFLYKIDEAAFLLALKTKDKAYIKETLEDIFIDEYYINHNRVSILRTVVSIVYVNCIRALRETVGEVDDKINQWYQQIFEAILYDDLKVLQNELEDFCMYIIEEVVKSRNLLKNSLVMESLEYLKENYTNPNLTLKSTSQHLNISSSYFSTIFKKETGKSFIDTLTEMKMNKAKDLVLTTEMKMFEIASECGYDDQHYFSYSFKKYFDVSPTKMRKAKENEYSKL